MCNCWIAIIYLVDTAIQLLNNRSQLSTNSHPTFNQHSTDIATDMSTDIQLRYWLIRQSTAPTRHVVSHLFRKLNKKQMHTSLISIIISLSNRSEARAQNSLKVLTKPFKIMHPYFASWLFLDSGPFGYFSFLFFH